MVKAEINSLNTGLASFAGKRVANFFIQPKLTVNQPNDIYENEADATADKIMRMPAANFLQRKCTHCEEDENQIQRKAISNINTPFIQKKSETNAVANDSVTKSINATRGSGSTLNGETKSFMESRFGADFSRVNIHTGTDSIQLNRDLNAHAFTVGSDIYFNEGKFQPQTDSGKHLLAHELTHVLQQNKNAINCKHQDFGGTVSNTRIDGFYEWHSSYQLDVSGKEAMITININLVPDKGVTSAEVEKVKRQTKLEFSRYWDNRFMLRDPDGDKIPLRMKINFVKDIAELTIALHKGTSYKKIVKDNTVTIVNEQEDQENWYVDSEPAVRAHELGHQLGMLDEYVDPASPDRTDDKSPGVFEDNSLMNSPESEGADVKLRHGQQLAKDISAVTRDSYSAEWSDTYIVRSGDRMKTIAKRIYGDESAWRVIYELNKDQIKNYTLKPGQVLKVPRGSGLRPSRIRVD